MSVRDKKNEKKNRKNAETKKVRQFEPKAGPNSHPTKKHNIESPEHHSRKLRYLVDLYLNNGLTWDEFMFAKVREMHLTVDEVETVALRIIAIEQRHHSMAA